MNTDTICAIATALSPSGIGIVRISGDEAFDILEKAFVAKKKLNIKQANSHTIHYGHIVDGDEIIDEVLVMIMKGPHTYTREDTVEIDCHGGVLVMKKVLQVLLNNGGRIAEPGEYTKRAFLNGRIDLAQAESVIDLIDSKNDYARKSSIAQLSGSVSNEIRNLRGKIIHEIAYIEAALDDPEHYDLSQYGPILKDKMKTITNRLDLLIRNADNGRVLKEGIETVIIGKPNVGKSSLLNVLVGRERAIVTEIAGTTRDSLEEQIYLDGITLNVIDTAGIRSTDNIVEKIGVEKSKTYINQADLVIYLVDGSVSLDENDYEIMTLLKDKKVIILLNKSDLQAKTTREDIEKILNHRVIAISAKEQQGIDQLENQIKELFFNGEVSYNDEVVITNMRHKQALVEANKSFQLVIRGIDDKMPEDFLSIDLMNGYSELGKILGESVNEDLVAEIFSSFCMGK